MDNKAASLTYPIHKHIKDLLYWHECVILPGFGGLVINYTPASIHPATHEFDPPTSALAFNQRLSQNDGLLIKYISRVESLSYNSTAKEVENWLKDLKANIDNKEKVELTGIGTFKRDVENNIRFQPDPDANFIKDSYGLRKFTAFPILREGAKTNEQEQSESPSATIPLSPDKEQGEVTTGPSAKASEATTNNDTTQNKTVNKKRQQPVRDYAIAATVLTIIAVAQLFFFNVTPDQLSLGHLPVFERFNPVSDKELLEDKASKEATGINEELNGDELGSLRYQAPATEGFSLPSDKKKKESKGKQKSTSAEGYYVILGSFQAKANAKQLKETISDKPHARIFQSPNGHNRVGYLLAQEEEEALDELKRLRNRKGDNLWLMAYRN